MPNFNAKEFFNIRPAKRKKESKPPLSKPKTLFEEKNLWHRKDLRMKIKKTSPNIPGTSAKYFKEERKKMIDKVFPEKKFGSHISVIEAKNRLRELRKEEFKSSSGLKKKEAKRLRSYLDRETGLKGKY